MKGLTAGFHSSAVGKPNIPPTRARPFATPAGGGGRKAPPPAMKPK